MSTPVADPAGLLALALPLGVRVRHFLALGAKHTGLPVVVVAAIVIVATFRIARHAAQFAFHVAVVVALLAAATTLGWLTW